MWELFPRQEQEFHGLGAEPVAFPEIESTYDEATARDEAARCYRCDAETGSADYSVQHREDIFSMARTNPLDAAKHRAMLDRRLGLREDPFPEGRPATLDDLTFLPANLSRLVIDPYREACRIDVDLAGKMALTQPFFVTGFDDAPEEVRTAVAKGLATAGCGYIGARPLGDGVPWLQLAGPGDAPAKDAAAVIHRIGGRFEPPKAKRLRDDQLIALAVSTPAVLADAIPYAHDWGALFSRVLPRGGSLREK